MEEKRKGKGLVILVILLVVVVLGLVGYICYDKGLILSKKSQVENKNEKVVNTEKEEELDINSRLVQELYNRVSTIEDNGTCRYGYYLSDDFYVENGEEDTKMRLVGRQLGREGRTYLSDDEKLKVDKEIKEDSDGVSMYYYLSDKGATYSKEYIEKIYKIFYGVDAKLNTSVKVYMDYYNVEVYIYNSAIDKYVLYNGEGGGTCGPVVYDASITKAIVANNSLKIYESIKSKAAGDFIGEDKEYKQGDITSDEKYVYTFKLDDDGMYSFVSRIKEK